MAKLYIGNTAYKVMLGNNSGHFIAPQTQLISSNTFISRQTGGGNLTIDATNGKVLKVEGNSVVWNQKVKNGDFNNGIDSWTPVNVSTSINNKILTITRTTTEVCRVFQNIEIFPNHKYYMSVKTSGGNGYVKSIHFGTLNGILSGNDEAKTLSSEETKLALVTSPKDITNVVILRVGFSGVPIGVSGNFSNFRILDLTLLNYPNIATTTPTVAQVEEWLANNVELKDYYPYDGGSILNVKMLGIKTTLPNTWIENKDFDVTRVWGKLNGEGSYAQVYPDGMRGVNDVKDVLYLNDDRAEVKIGSVDLGSLMWFAIPTSVSGKKRFITDKITLIKSSTTNSLCSIYVAVQSTYTADKIGYAINGQQMLVYDEKYAQSDDTTFKTAMQGVPLIYELATPLTYTNLMYDQSQANDGSDLIPLSVLTYRVDANGTEEIIRPTSVNGEPTSLAPTMDIKYVNLNLK